MYVPDVPGGKARPTRGVGRFEHECIQVIKRGIAHMRRAGYQNGKVVSA
jgi:hypothetical protein